MIVDFKDAPSSVFEEAYDLCVCGSGPAGITVAREVAAAGGRVLLLEGGGLSPSAESQAVYQGKSVGSTPYYGIEACRLRYLGGTSGHWAGRCAMLDPIDFEQRDIFDLPSWPISYREAYARIDSAKSILDLAPSDLGAPGSLDGFTPTRFRRSVYARSAPTRFGDKYRNELSQSDRIVTVLNANVTDLAMSPQGDTITGAEVTGYDGSKQTALADRFVVAFGAMENARFLLNANGGRGVGNDTDMVGRTFMEHFEVNFGRFFATNPAFWSKLESNLSVMPTDDTMRARKMGNATVALSVDGAPKFYGRTAALKRVQRDVTCGSPKLLSWARQRGDFACEGDGSVGTIMEQTPNKNSRVLLQDDAVDQFGKPRLALQLELSDVDRHTLSALGEEVGKMLAAADLARLRVYQSAYDKTVEAGHHCHHMGTTRMADNPRDGVVDRDCRVHGFNNLYMGGASVFSTGGGVNPTLTIVALALRLGEHLGGKLSRA